MPYSTRHFTTANMLDIMRKRVKSAEEAVQRASGIEKDGWKARLGDRRLALKLLEKFVVQHRQRMHNLANGVALLVTRNVEPPKYGVRNADEE